MNGARNEERQGTTKEGRMEGQLEARMVALQAGTEQLRLELVRQEQQSRALQAQLRSLTDLRSLTGAGRTGLRGPEPSQAGLSSETRRAPEAQRALSGAVTRRRMLALTGTGIVGGVAAAVLADAPRAGAVMRRPATAASSAASDPATPSILVPVPTGDASTDTANILDALSRSTPGTQVVLQCLTSTAYLVDQELPVPAGVRVTAMGANCEGGSVPPNSGGGTMPTLLLAPGSSLICVLASAAYLAGLYGPANPGNYPAYNALYGNGVSNQVADSAIEVDHLAINGNNGGAAPGNTTGHGVVLFSGGSKVHDCFIFNTGQAGIVVADCNYDGAVGSGFCGENRIYDNKTFNTGQQAIAVISTSGSPGCLNGYILNNILVASSKSLAIYTGGPNIDPQAGIPYEGVHMDIAAGWWIVNNHLYQIPGSGCYLNCAWGLHYLDNSTDDFGFFPTNGQTYVSVDIHLSDPPPGTSFARQPVFVHGNQSSAYEGYNSNNKSGAGNRAANSTNEFLYHRVVMTAAGQQSPDLAAFVVHSENSSHQNSPPARSVTGAAVRSGSADVSFGDSVTGLVQQGMSVADSHGAVPAGTFVGGVAEDGLSITLVDGTGAAVEAKGTFDDDTISFPGPTSIAWSYVNFLTNSTLTINRTNELITPTVGAVPHTTGGVRVIDPIGFVGGLPISGTPATGRTIVATGPSTAEWASPPASAPTGPAGGVLGGTYPNPTLAPTAATAIRQSGTYEVPVEATTLRITCVGGGGGGGGGGGDRGTRRPVSHPGQVGGAGGAAGTASTQVVHVGGNTHLAIRIGRGGGAGKGIATGDGHAADGTAGGFTTVTGTGVAVAGSGGSGGKGGAAGSIVASHGAAYGAVAGSATASATGGCGGSSGLAGGYPIGLSPGGGGGGGATAGDRGGGGGRAGSARTLGAAGEAGGAPTATGRNGSDGSDPGSPGGGGGATAADAAGGRGGAGAPGIVFIEVIG